MKKKIICISILLILAILVFSFIFSLKLKENKIDFDYSEYEDKEIFYQRLDDIFLPYESNYLIDKNRNVKNYTRFLFIDKELNPIPEASIEVYDDEDNKYILTANANSKGEIAINNLELNTKYKFKQTKTRDGLVVDNTAYTTTVSDTVRRGFQIIVNSQEELTKEEKEEIIQEYKDSIIEKNTTYNIESDQRKDEKIRVADNEYILLKDRLEGKTLNISLDYPIKKDEKFYHKCSVRITDAYILDCKVEVLYNDFDNVKIFDLDYNERYDFKNGEGFYICTSKVNTFYNVDFKFYITLKYEDKTYKICKTVALESPTVKRGEKGEVKATIYSPDNEKEFFNGGKVIFERVSNSGKITYMGQVILGSDGRVNLYNVPEGRYNLIKVVDKKAVQTKTIEVTKNKITQVEF